MYSIPPPHKKSQAGLKLPSKQWRSTSLGCQMLCQILYLLCVHIIGFTQVPFKAWEMHLWTKTRLTFTFSAPPLESYAKTCPHDIFIKWAPGHNIRRDTMTQLPLSYLDLLILLSSEVLGAHRCNGHKALQLLPTSQKERNRIATTHGRAYQNRLLESQLLEDLLQESNTALCCLNSAGAWGLPIACWETEGTGVIRQPGHTEATINMHWWKNMRLIPATNFTNRSPLPKVKKTMPCTSSGHCHFVKHTDLGSFLNSMVFLCPILWTTRVLGRLQRQS